jgi:hypothetical protein
MKPVGVMALLTIGIVDEVPRTQAGQKCLDCSAQLAPTAQ